MIKHSVISYFSYIFFALLSIVLYLLVMNNMEANVNLHKNFINNSSIKSFTTVECKSMVIYKYGNSMSCSVYDLSFENGLHIDKLNIINPGNILWGSQGLFGLEGFGLSSVEENTTVVLLDILSNSKVKNMKSFSTTKIDIDNKIFNLYINNLKEFL